MPALGKLRCWIEMDSAPLAEYHTIVNKENGSVSCDVVSEAGKRFVICLSHGIRLPESVKAVAKVYIDGVQTNHLIIDSSLDRDDTLDPGSNHHHHRRYASDTNNNGDDKDSVTRCEGTLIAHNAIRPFTFNALPPNNNAHSRSVSEPSSATSTPSPSSNRISFSSLGSINVIVRLATVKILEETQEVFKPKVTEESLNGRRAWEDSAGEEIRKRSPHYTSFGKEMPTPVPTSPVLITPLTKYNSVRFKFNYGPRVESVLTRPPRTHRRAMHRRSKSLDSSPKTKTKTTGTVPKNAVVSVSMDSDKLKRPRPSFEAEKRGRLDDSDTSRDYSRVDGSNIEGKGLHVRPGHMRWVSSKGDFLDFSDMSYI